jgi:hypothetical protein
VRAADGSIAIGWVRRSRGGWDWTDGAETPLGEEREAYRVTLSGASGARTIEVAQPACVYGVTEQEADGFAGALEVEVVQLGTAAASRPARRRFPEI